MSEEEDPNQQEHKNQQDPQPSEETTGDSGVASNKIDNDNVNADGVSKRIRLAKAQAEIDRILNNPVDAPFDFETEMEKVVSITPPLVKEGTSEHELEQQVSQMEEDLYNAVKAQDFATAAQRKNEISQLHVDDCGLVLQVNSAYYKAFGDKDIREMERIWLKDRSCVCIHPSFQPLHGIRDVMDSWKRMFEASTGSWQRTWVEPRDIRLTVKATTAVVTCEEHVFVRLFVRGKSRKSELVNKLMATNIFRKVGGRWYMTYHHSSWHADSEQAKVALKHKRAGGTATGRGRVDPTIRKRSSRSYNNGDDSSQTGIDNIVGFPLSRKEDDSDDASGSIRPSFLFSRRTSEPGDLFSMLMDLRKINKRVSGSSTPQDFMLSGEFSDDSGDDDDDDDEDDDDEDDDDEVVDELDDDDDETDEDDSNDDNGNGSRTVSDAGRKKPTVDISGDNSNKPISMDSPDVKDFMFKLVSGLERSDSPGKWFGISGDDMDEDGSNKDDRNGSRTVSDLGRSADLPKLLTSLSKIRPDDSESAWSISQKCIKTLRKLANEGRISPKQKRVLYNDVISRLSKSEPSDVVVAYKLLCIEGNDPEEAEEEFVDQCQVIAQSLSNDDS